MRLGFLHALLIFCIFYGVFISLFLFNGVEIGGPIGYFILFIMTVLISFIVFQVILMALRTEMSFWVTPVLKLAAQLIKLDGKVDNKEIKKVKKFLSQEMGEPMAINRFKFFTKQIKKENFDYRSTISYLKNNSTGSDKIKMIQFLVGIAISDRYLSLNEENFIKSIVKELSLPRATLEMIYGLYNYVTEREKNVKQNRVLSSYKLEKAYKVLELEPTANLDEVKESYRRLAKLFHPDVRNKLVISKETANTQFQVIANAYELIKKSKE